MSSEHTDKARISMTIDPKLLRRIDAVCESRNEPRSSMIERILENEMDEEEQFVKDMENPVLRALARIIADTPGVTKFLASLGGMDTGLDNIENLKSKMREQIGKGQERQKGKRKGKAAEAVE